MTAEWLSAWGTVFGAIAASAAVVVAAVQLPGIRKGLALNSIMMVLEIETQMNERKMYYDECSTKVRLGAQRNEPTEVLEIRGELLKAAKENYFNSLDRLCYCILRDYLEDKDWRAEYRTALNNAIITFPNDFLEGSPFRNMKKLNALWQST